MSFYSQWYEQSVCLRGSSNNAINRIGEVNVSTGAVQVDLTPIHITVSSVKNRIVYNEEYKTSEVTTNPERRRIRTREGSVASTELKTSSPHVGAAANAIAARFAHQNHSRRHSRQGSSVSDTIYVTTSSDSLWEDWIVKYLHEGKNAAAAEEASMEEWIFETL